MNANPPSFDDNGIGQDDARSFVRSIARTNVQLYNQLVAQARPEPELLLIRRAYDLASQLYSGSYHGDGKPFITHVVTVASTVTLLGMSSTWVAMALLHNVYVNADFGDGLHASVTDRRRRIVIDAVGEEVESRIRRFPEVRLERELDRLMREAPQMDGSDRELLTVVLADRLEKMIDGGVLYIGRNDQELSFATRRMDDLAALATSVGQPLLGEALRWTIAEVGARRIPAVLRSAPDRRFMAYHPSPSYWPKPAIVLRRWRARLSVAVRRLRQGGRATSVAREPID